jgi:hypothetical protein
MKIFPAHFSILMIIIFGFLGGGGGAGDANGFLSLGAG